MITPTYGDGQMRLYCGDTLEVLTQLGTGTVNCVVTSPPYWRKRDYGIAGQYGLEETFQGYVATLRSVFTEVHRVLSNRGTLWLNLGDSHITSAAGTRTNPGTLHGTPNSRTYPQNFGAKRGLVAKNLVGAPWRVAFALQEDGWILRNTVIWHKTNAMPESVEDRFSCRYENIFLFVKQRSYHFDLDSVRVPRSNTKNSSRRNRRSGGALPRYRRLPNKYIGAGAEFIGNGPKMRDPGRHHSASHTHGRNPGDVWDIPTRPLPQAHFAAFPIDIPLRAIRAGCPEGGTVLDPFSGAGTTLVAARELGRHGIGIDLQPAYHAIAIDRLNPHLPQSEE